MSNSNNAGCLSILIIALPIASWLGTGTLAWNWVEPDDFGGGILFLIVWGVFGAVAQFLISLLMAFIASNMD